VATVRCWYCNTENDPLSNAGFCNRCGRKLENAPETGIVDAPVRPTEPTGQLSPYPDDDFSGLAPIEWSASEPQKYELRKNLGQASGALLVMAALQFVCGLIGVLAFPRILGLDGDSLVFVIAAVLVVGVAGAYVGLGIWARYQPLPPTIIGLVLYVVMVLANIILSGDRERVWMGIWVPILLIIMLARGVVAANKYNKLVRQIRDDY
jgi:hypothetical protein